MSALGERAPLGFPDRQQEGRHCCGDTLVRELKSKSGDRITAELESPAKPGQYAEFPDDLDHRLRDSLRGRGISKLYSHQAQAWKLIRQRKHTVIVTPTASGKTLCYNLPVLHEVLTEKAKALYLFPTKALSQDQVAELVALNRSANLGVRAFTFDGDTPGDARKAVRTRGDIVVSNPDMLHQGILPHHTKWAQFFETLRFIVIDEMHIYRGVFGSHVANVIRRLKRVCAFYGANPVFILCSATIANPGELAEALIGDSVHTLSKSGAPQGAKHLLLWNPPVVNADLAIRASARSQTYYIARLAVAKGLKTIAFTSSRLMVEVLVKYLKDAFDKDPRYPPRVKAYRGGYLPTERREIEKQLRNGDIGCVVATVALELGVDIGALDVAILNGYPGTVAGTRQRLGRAGRRNRASLGVVVANSSPLDQFIMRNPEFLLEASPEHAHVDPDQLLILMDHVRCGAFELPFKDGERFGKEDLGECLRYLQEERVVHHESGRWHWMSDDYPANGVSLRTVAEGNFVVVDVTNGGENVIAEVDYSSASVTLYEGAIYMVQARPWQVEQLDWEGRKAFVRETRANFYTDAIDYSRLKILEEFEQVSSTQGRCAQGEVHLVRRVAGYKKVKFGTHENIGYGKVNLPDQEMHTTAIWWQANRATLDALFESTDQALDGFIGAAHAMHFIAALLTMSELRDLGRTVGSSDASWCTTVGMNGRGELVPFTDQALTLDDLSDPLFNPTVFLYDNYPGGTGLTASLFDLKQEVIARAHELIDTCECTMGCPACIGPILAPDEQTYSPKKNARQVLLLLSNTDIRGS